MGPPRDVGSGSRGLSSPAPKGVWRCLQREKPGLEGLLSSSRSGFPMRGSAFGKALPQTAVVSYYTATHYKNTSAGNPGIETKDQTGMGDGYRTM